MKYYKFTLLKDLPDIKAGFTFTLTEDQFANPFRWHYVEDSEKVYEVCRYKDDPEWVKVEFDLSRAIQIKCPDCDTVGMFDYEGNEVSEHDDGVDSYYKPVGLWCPHCNFLLVTHNVHTRTKVCY